MISKKCLMSLMVASSVCVAPAVLADVANDSVKNVNVSEMGRADLPNYDDGDSIVLSGKVLAVSEDELVLDYGGQKLDVEFEAWPWEGKNMNKFFEPGQKVTVSGTVDKDWFSENEIEASNIYLDDQYVYYYWVDQTPAYYLSVDQSERKGPMKNVEDGAFFSASGEITKIDGREFTMQSGQDKFTVDTWALGYNPLDEQGLQRLEVGDRVYVSGDVDAGFYEGKELSAQTVITLQDASDMSEDDQLASN